MLERLRAAWPSENMLLLLEASLAPLPEAKTAWAKWKSISDLDTASWPEVRLIGSLHSRIDQLEPGGEAVGKIKGFRRFFFASNHRLIADVLPILRDLRAEGIEIMLIKGTSRLAHEPSLLADRYVADVDALIRTNDFSRVYRLAAERSWNVGVRPHAFDDGTPESAFAHTHALELAPGTETPKSHIDVHHFARYMCRNIGDDDDLWRNAVEVDFKGVSVKTPSPTDRLLITLSHALRYAKGAPTADWALDAAALIASSEIDWSHLLAGARASLTEAYVAGALLLLNERVGVPLPDGLLKDLTASIKPVFLDEFRSLTTGYLNSWSNRKLLPSVVDAAKLRAARAAKRQTEATAPHFRKPAALQELPRSLPEDTTATVAIPSRYRRNDEVTLDLRFDVDSSTGEARVGVLLPHLYLHVWDSRDGTPANTAGRVTMTIDLPMKVVRMGGMQRIGVRTAVGTSLRNLSLRFTPATPFGLWQARFRKRRKANTSKVLQRT